MELIESKCDHCGKKFKATFDQLDNTGFVTILRTKKGMNIRDFNFCTYKCEEKFITKMKRIDPEFADTWKKPSEENRTRYPEYYRE